ncbi:MAG: prolipoprotein diacylglyceryl transferase [Candidatus Omnitrophica bacterium]|nr:prolipoprotein diacylglyceryl transferase [Candidatus Omnitrophota bacterium]
MHPEICKLGPITLYSYGLMLVVGFMVASFLMVRYAKAKNFNPDIIFNVGFIGLVSGILGARALYVLQNSSYYAHKPWEILFLQQGGLSLYGGLIVGVICGIVYLKRLHQDVLSVLDCIIPFVALAQAFGRIGCLLNGCCFGRHSVWGIFFPVHNDYLLPTQIYSSFGLLVIFVVLRFLQEKPHVRGTILYAYLALYALKRFIIEFWRADNPALIGSLTIFHLFSIAMFVFACAMLIFILRKKQ